MKQKGKKILASNRKARHEFFIEDTIEAGIVLKGVEVKSIRQGKVNLKESYGVIDRGEVYLYGCHISPYEQGNIQNVDPLRKRKLLLHKREIRRLEEAVNLKGLTLIPLSMYLKDGKIKVELATAKGKKLYDKRRDIAERDAKRRIRQQMSEKYNQ